LTKFLFRSVKYHSTPNIASTNDRHSVVQYESEKKR